MAVRRTLSLIESAHLYQSSQRMSGFTGALFFAGEARAAQWYWYHKRRATLPVGKKRPALRVGHNGPSGALRHLPDTPHRTAHRAYPNVPF